MWIAIIIIVAAFAIALPIAISRGKKVKAMLDQGQIIKRSSRYAEKGEEFTSKIGTFVALKKELLKMQRPCNMSGNTGTVVNFTASSYEARLYKVDFDEASGIGIYRFEFTKWRTGRYGYEEDTSMNMLMTSVEKAFLNLDPNTGVKFYDLDFKTKHRLF